MAPELNVTVLRELFRNIQSFRALHEAGEIEDVITGPGGQEWALWDVEYLLEQINEPWMPRRMREAIQLCLVENMKESDAAVVMGVSPTNPVAIYATEGLKKLVERAEDGLFPRFRARTS